jgi:peptide/nickel transport system ATP-binding protein
VLEVGGLDVAYRGTPVLRDVSLTIRRGDRIALLGQSGSGKTTFGRCVAGLVDRAGGEIRLNGRPLPNRVAEREQSQRRAVQMVLQNPYGSFNPRFTIGAALSRAVRMFRGDAPVEPADLLARVRLPATYAEAYPDQLSGGELQRAAIAQALAAGPDLIICDEATSALDVSVQAVVIELLRTLSEEEGVALLIISHDLGVVGSLSEETHVLENGHIVEHATTADLLRAPRSDLARRLIAARPDLGDAAETPADHTADAADQLQKEADHDPIHT